MKNDPTFNHAMARVYRTAVALSSLIISASAAQAADPPVPRSNVSVNVNPTTGYYSTSNTTLRLPDGVRATPTAGASTVTKYAGGLQQSIPTGITIDAIKKTAPLPVVVRAKTSSLKRAATGCLKSGRCNLALLAAGEGLNQLFNGLDWIMGDGGKVQKKVTDGIDPTKDVNLPYKSPPEFWPTTLSGGCPAANTPAVISGDRIYFSCSYQGSSRQYCPLTLSGNSFKGRYNGVCQYGPAFPDFLETTTIPLSDSDIESGVGSHYVPEPTDWPALTPELDLDDIEITSSPTLQGEPITETIYDADGNPHKVRQTNIWYDFDIRDNPSPKPKLDVKKREETKTFEDGVLTGTTTTKSTASAGSDDTPPPPEPPIDCDLFPTACAWFEWTQEEPVEPDDDLSPLLQEVPIVSETYTITGGVAACPAPLVLDLSVFGSREVSYQPLCDLASTMKYLYLALMSFAAAVLLHRSINRV